MADRIDGRYELIGELGEGESASVLLVQDLALERRVALKLAADADGGERLRREFELLGRLDHPQLPAVLAFGEDRERQRSYFTLDYLEGEVLAAFSGAEAERLGEPTLARLLAQGCHLLAYFERSGLVHGDVKPSNLIVCTDPDGAPLLKVIDLGLGGVAGGGRRGWIRGTMRYASPSVHAGEPPDGRSDLHALGATFLDVCGAWQSEGPPDLELSVELRGILARMTAPDEDARYQSAEDALSDLGRLGVHGGDQDAGTLFVGRAESLERLRSFALASGSAGHVMLVHGEAGVGKSALVREAQRGFELQGGRVVVGRAKPDSGPLEAWRAALRHLELVEGATRGVSEEGLARAGTNERFERVREALRTSARERALLVILEDAQDLDEASLDCLVRLAALRADGTWGVVVVARDGDPERAAHEALAESSASDLHLERLAEEEAGALIDALLPRIESSLRESVLKVGKGNPLLLRSAARAVRLQPHAPLERTLRGELPKVVEDELQRRIDSLTPEERQAARVWSVHRLPADVRHHALALDVSVAHAAALVARLEARGVLERVPGTQERYAFAEAALQLALEEELDPDERRALHGRALAALRSRPDPSVEMCQALFSHASAAEDAPAVDRFGPQAVSALLSAHLPGAAARTFRRYHDQVRARGQGLTVAGAELQGDVGLALGELPQARSSFEAALKGMAASQAPQRSRVLRKMAQVLIASGDFEPAEARLREALEVRGEPLETALVHKSLALMARRRGDPREAERCLRTALQLLGAGADVPEAAALWNNLGVLAFDRCDHAEAAEHWAHALRIHRRNGDTTRESKALTNVAAVRMVLGDLTSAQEALESAARLKKEIGDRRSLASTVSNLAVLERWRARFGRALQLEERALREREEIGDRAGIARSRLSLALVWLDKGDLGRAHESAVAAHAMARSTGERDSIMGEALVTLALVEEDLGRLERALAHVEEGLGLADVAGLRHVAVRLAVLRLVLTQERDGDEGWSAVLEEVRELREPRVLGQSLLDAAQACLHQGQVALAKRHASEGAALASSVGYPHLEGRAALLLGACAFREGDDDRASRELLQALERARALGTPRLEAAACAALARFADRQGRRPRAVGWLRAALERYQGGVESLRDAPELQDAYLAHPERAVVLRQLEDWLEG